MKPLSPQFKYLKSLNNNEEFPHIVISIRTKLEYRVHIIKLLGYQVMKKIFSELSNKNLSNKILGEWNNYSYLFNENGKFDENSNGFENDSFSTISSANYRRKRLSVSLNSFLLYDVKSKYYQKDSQYNKSVEEKVSYNKTCVSFYQNEIKNSFTNYVEYKSNEYYKIKKQSGEQYEKDNFSHSNKHENSVDDDVVDSTLSSSPSYSSFPLGNSPSMVSSLHKLLSRRNFYHSSSFTPYLPSHVKNSELFPSIPYYPDSDEENDVNWLLDNSNQSLDEFRDLLYSETTIMKLWNEFQLKKYFIIYNDKSFVYSLFLFVEIYYSIIHKQNLRYSLLLFVITCWEYKLIENFHIQGIMKFYDELVDKINKNKNNTNNNSENQQFNIKQEQMESTINNNNNSMNESEENSKIENGQKNKNKIPHAEYSKSSESFKQTHNSFNSIKYKPFSNYFGYFINIK